MANNLKRDLLILGSELRSIAHLAEDALRHARGAATLAERVKAEADAKVRYVALLEQRYGH